MQIGEKKNRGVEIPKFKLLQAFFKNADLRNLYLTQISTQSVAWGMIFFLPDILKTRGYEEGMIFGGGHLTFILGEFAYLFRVV